MPAENPFPFAVAVRMLINLVSGYSRDKNEAQLSDSLSPRVPEHGGFVRPFVDVESGETVSRYRIVYIMRFCRHIIDIVF
jgi:hypothetical protein